MDRFGVSPLSLWTREDENFCIELITTTSLIVDALCSCLCFVLVHDGKLLLEIPSMSMFSTHQALPSTCEFFEMNIFTLDVRHQEELHLFLRLPSIFWFICSTHEAFEIQPS